MTTREELIDGFRMIIREGLRTTKGFGPDDWSFQVHDEGGGWTARQVYCHLTASAEITPGFIAAAMQAPTGQRVGAGMDIDAFNAQGVARLEQLSPEELRQAFSSAYEKVIEFVRQMPDEQLGASRSVGYLVDTPVAEIMDSVLVLHGLSHIYHAQSRPWG